MADKSAAEYIREWYHNHPGSTSRECFDDLTAQGVETSLKSVQNLFSNIRKKEKNKDKVSGTTATETMSQPETKAPPAEPVTHPTENSVAIQDQTISAPQPTTKKNKGGRPKSSDKTERMTLMLSPADKKRLALLAAINGISAADLIASWIDRAYAETRDSGAFSDV